MALCLGQVFSPRVKPVAFDEKTVRRCVFIQCSGYRVCKGLHVLRVLHDWQPFAMLVRADALQSFQHLVVFDVNTTCGAEEIGEHRVPN